jgi:ribosomal protein S5
VTSRVLGRDTGSKAFDNAIIAAMQALTYFSSTKKITNDDDEATKIHESKKILLMLCT